MRNPKLKDTYSYKDKGKHIIQIKRYAECFSKENMLFVLAEDLKEGREETLKKILKFLEMNEDFVFSDLKEKHVGGIPRSLFLAKLAGSKWIRNHHFIRDVIKRVNTKKGKTPPMKEETRKKLQKYFEPYNEELEKFTGLNLGKWRR